MTRILSLYFILLAFSAYSENVESLLEKLDIAEQKVNTSKANYYVNIVDKGEMLWDGEWVSEYPKGYLRGKKSVKFPDRELTSYEEIYAFDGKVLDTFCPEPNRNSGTVRELTHELDSVFSPQSLLGYSIKAEGRYRLSDVLRESDNVMLMPETKLIDGHECYFLEVTVADSSSAHGSGSTAKSDKLHLWLDKNRDFRPLRIELYSDLEATKLRYTLEDIHLEKVGDTWLPMTGLWTVYTSKLVPQDGYALEDLQKMLPEEMEKHGTIIREARDGGIQKITLRKWEILDDIDDELFSIDFPEGAHVWDDFAQVDLYEVNKNTSSDMSLTVIEDRDSLNQEADNRVNGSKNTTGDNPPDTQNKSDNRRRGILLVGFLLGITFFLYKKYNTKNK